MCRWMRLNMTTCLGLSFVHFDVQMSKMVQHLAILGAHDGSWSCWMWERAEGHNRLVERLRGA